MNTKYKTPTEILNEKAERILSKTSGKFTGIETWDGRKFNAKIEKTTPFYVIFRDRNQSFSLHKIAKSSIRKINQKNVW